MAARYQYEVVELREGLIGGKMSGEKLQKVRGDHAGPGGVEGLLVTFERPVG